MDQYAGWDVALKETSIPVRQNRKRIWRGKCLPEPQLVAEMIRKHAPYAVLVVFETGPPTWFHRKLTADGLKAAGIDARHAKAARDTASHKTGANDADGLSLLAKAGFFREVRGKSPAAMRRRALTGGRAPPAFPCLLNAKIHGSFQSFAQVTGNDLLKPFKNYWSQIRRQPVARRSMPCG